MKPSVQPSPSALSHVATAPAAIAPIDSAMASHVTCRLVSAGPATLPGTAARARTSPTAAPVRPATNRRPAVEASNAPTAYRPVAPRSAATAALTAGGGRRPGPDGAAAEGLSARADAVFAYRSEGGRSSRLFAPSAPGLPRSPGSEAPIGSSYRRRR